MSSEQVPSTAQGGVPSHAAAMVALLNSRAHTIHPEKLETSQTAADVLRRLGHADIGVSEDQLGELRALRSDLMAVLTAAHEGSDTAPFWAQFTARTSTVTYQQHFEAPAQVHLRQVAGDPVVGRVAGLAADLIDSGHWGRLRVCANDECRSVFYDTTRSRTQRWHSYEICGNKHNVANYRARGRGTSHNQHA